MTTVFEPRPLPASVAGAIRTRLGRAHRRLPFSTADPRETVRRVTGILEDLPVRMTVYRGGLDLRGVEVDHVWIALERRERTSGSAYVLDAAFPLYEQRFVELLRRFVVGEADAADLERAATLAGVDARVIGEFPAPMRYVGEPVWGQRSER